MSANKKNVNGDNIKIKYKDIPFEFKTSNWSKAVEFCDNQTSLFCYCGRLATGFHTNSCKKFIEHVQMFIENLYNQNKKEVKPNEQEKASNT